MHYSRQEFEKGMNATIELQSNKGRGARAIYLESSIGKQDLDATVAKLILEGFYRYIDRNVK